MNIHLAYFLTALGETLAAFVVMKYYESTSDSIKSEHVAAALVTTFIAAYSGFYLLDVMKFI